MESEPYFRPAVLIAVGSKPLREASRLALASCGYEVMVTDDGRAAIAYLHESAVPPDLIVVDTELPEVPASVLADVAARRGARCLPLASNRFVIGRPPNKEDGFDLSTLVVNVQESLGARAVFRAD